jgi:cytochrome b561
MGVVLRYHPLLVVLHWSLAFLIPAALALGALRLAPMSNASPLKYDALHAHMLGGIAILILMSLRLLLRNMTPRPAAADTGTAALDVLARISHRAFYALAIAMPVTGLIMAGQTGVIGIVANAHPTLPADFWAFPIRSIHYLLSRALMMLIVLHLAGVIYHTFIRKDRLLRRMTFGRRTQLQTAALAESPR